MKPNYPKMVAETVAELPVSKQAEVYNFVKFMKNETIKKAARKKQNGGSVFDLFGTAVSKVTDASTSHDKYLT